MQLSGARAGFLGERVRLGDAMQSIESLSRVSTSCTLSRPGALLAGVRLPEDTDTAKGYWELLRLGSDLFVVVSNLTYEHNVTIPVIGEDLIEFHFRLSGDLRLVSDDESAVNVSKGSLLIWRQPEGCNILEHVGGDGHRELSLTIYCRPTFLERHFGAFGRELDRELAAMLGRTCNGIRSMQAALYPGLNRLVVELASCEAKDGIQLVRAEALALQIICEVLSNVELQKRVPKQDVRLSDRDVACLQRAKDALVRQHTPAPTIEELGRRVGLSPTKLKSGFRTLFGETIYEFANALRMNAAKELLRKSDRPIGHISAELGYEYQNSFTVAFRRQYGMLPRDYRRDPIPSDAACTAEPL